ncbi:helix-turn-helix transcriptional regulator [Candidatus Acetothermia bacterium]|nr:helix-turn-helix transcriptional regulator [Candidatus Acetothermia bacterium]MBI3461423.1 helix-turn-helix transcriptional regulator [Candidatus Acetothermia bacterium]MBI3659777.1 helix-turn-helix transcriptional regulator [Candidatus Acetothermia bacterium]
MAKRKNRYEEFEKRVLARPGVRQSFEEGLDWLRLAASIAERRAKLKLTQTQLAAMLHTSPSVISRVEHGENIELKTLQKIARALNVKIKIELVENGAR